MSYVNKFESIFVKFYSLKIDLVLIVSTSEV